MKTKCVIAAVLIGAVICSVPVAMGQQGGQTPPPETPAQKAERHKRELTSAEQVISTARSELHLLRAPEARTNHTRLWAEIAKLKDDPEFKDHKPGRPPPPKLQPGKKPDPKAKVLTPAAIHTRDLEVLRRQTEKVVQANPGLRAYAEQHYEWNKRVGALIDKYLDNPLVRPMAMKALAPPAKP